MSRIRITIALSAAAALVGAGSVLASTIVGTPRADVLRGTPTADKLYGKAGNDTLLGLTGNDVLVGGPGADRLRCGPGRDVAQADAKDRVARDCEIVKGLAAPSPPAPPPATPGLYCGPTSQDMLLCLEVVATSSAVRTIPNLRLAVEMDCRPNGQVVYTYEIRTFATVKSDSTFTAPVVLAGFAATVEGAFDVSSGSAAGSLRVQIAEDRAGVRYECDSGVVSWSAKAPPPDPIAQPGKFCGFTDQGQTACFDVAGTPKTVGNLELLVKTSCTPPATFGVSSTIPTRYVIREDGTFSFTRSGSGTTAGGGSFSVTHTMRGTFDPTGAAASGTLEAHVEYETGDGVHYECDSGTFGWSVRRQ